MTVLLAVSGGADSVALLRAIRALATAGEGRIVVGHFNHQLRGEQSAADEEFVVGLCRGLGVACEVGRAGVDEYGAVCGDGLEAAARAVRYGFLEQTAGRLGARYVVTAHTADDQAETILQRIIRGTGIGGLAGMARARPLGPAATLIRPMLGFRRGELLAYLQDLGQPYRADASNEDTRFTRNRIRHELLPQLAEQYNSGVVDALLRLGSLAGEVQTVVDCIVEDLADRCVAANGPDCVRIDAAKVAREPRYVIRELLMAVWRRQGWPLQAMGYSQWDALAATLCACGAGGCELPPQRMFPGGVLAEPSPGELRLAQVRR